MQTHTHTITHIHTHAYTHTLCNTPTHTDTHTHILPTLLWSSCFINVSRWEASSWKQGVSGGLVVSVHFSGSVRSPACVIKSFCGLCTRRMLPPRHSKVLCHTHTHTTDTYNTHMCSLAHLVGVVIMDLFFFLRPQTHVSVRSRGLVGATVGRLIDQWRQLH